MRQGDDVRRQGLVLYANRLGIVLVLVGYALLVSTTWVAGFVLRRSVVPTPPPTFLPRIRPQLIW